MGTILHSAPNSRRILRFRQTIDKTGLSRATIYRLLAAGEFVPKIQITQNAVGFLEADVDTWIQARIAAGKLEG